MICCYEHASCLLSFFKNNNNNVIVMDIIWTLLMGILMWNDTRRPNAKKESGSLITLLEQHHLLHKARRKTWFSHACRPWDSLWFNAASNTLVNPTPLCIDGAFCCPIISIIQRGETGSSASPRAQVWLGQERSYTYTKISTEFQSDSHSPCFPIFFILSSVFYTFKVYSEYFSLGKHIEVKWMPRFN